MRISPPAIFAVLVLFSLPGQTETEGRIRIQLGQEYDTNVRREYLQSQDDGLLRLILDGSLKVRNQSHLFSVDYAGGAKLFYSEESEHLMVNKLTCMYQHFPDERWSVGSRIIVHDASQWVHRRDFFVISGDLFRRANIMDWLFWEVFAGGRYFLFKPDLDPGVSRKYSNLGPFLGIRTELAWSASGSLSASYRINGRKYNQVADINSNGVITPSVKDRLEIRHVVALNFRYLARYYKEMNIIFKAGYHLSLNDSNSYGSEALWHRLNAVVSVQLPHRFSLHVMGTLQFTNYLDGIYLEGDLYEPDADENENSVVIRLSYALSENLSLIAQGGMYRNEFHGQKFDTGYFHRETFMLAVSMDLPL